MATGTILQVDLVVEIVQFLLDYPELGWIPTLLYLIIELRTKRGIVKGKLMEMIRANTVVVRAIARTNDQIDTEAAENLLTDNGHEPGDFIDMESQTAYETRMRRESEDEREGDPGVSSKDSGDD